MATKKKAEKTATPAKKTATKKATTKTAVKKPAVKKTAEPKGEAKKEIALPFLGVDSEPIVMKNGQTVRKSELPMLSGMVRLEVEFGKQYSETESAVSIAQTLLNSKKKGANLMNELAEFNTKHVLVTA